MLRKILTQDLKNYYKGSIITVLDLCEVLSMIGKVNFGGLYTTFGGQTPKDTQGGQNAKAQQNEQKQALINKNYNEIFSHEMAHKTAGGALAGSIVIEKNTDGIPVGGHVEIKMPSIDPENPPKAIDDANIVILAALAPSDPSDQDYKVAAKARSIKSKAQNMLTGDNGKKLNLIG